MSDPTCVERVKITLGEGAFREAPCGAPATVIVRGTLKGDRPMCKTHAVWYRQHLFELTPVHPKPKKPKKPRPSRAGDAKEIESSRRRKAQRRWQRRELATWRLEVRLSNGQVYMDVAWSMPVAYDRARKVADTYQAPVTLRHRQSLAERRTNPLPMDSEGFAVVDVIHPRTADCRA